MKIIIEGTPKEIADLVYPVQSQQNKKIRKVAGTIFSRFCDEYALHSDEIDAALAELATESNP